MNKTETKVTVDLPFMESKGLSDPEKERLQGYLSRNRPSALISDGTSIQLSDSSTRSQDKNKDLVIGKLKELIEKGLVVAKKRKRGRVPKASKEKRLSSKKHRSEIKSGRRKFSD